MGKDNCYDQEETKKQGKKKNFDLFDRLKNYELNL